MKDLSSTIELNATPDTSVGRQTLARQRFLVALLFSTWIPMLFFFTLAQMEATSFSVRSLKTIFLFLGTAHVPATLFFYTDKNFSHIVRQNRARYIYFPIILTIGSGLLVAFSSNNTQVFLFLIFWAWQAFHYGRQNLGIYSFASIAENTGGATKLEKLAIDLATICGVLGTLRILGSEIAPLYLHGPIDVVFQIGKFGYCAVIIFSAYVYAKGFACTTLVKSIFYWTLVLFFIPIYLSTNINVTFLSYAIAHGVQYIVFMSVVSYTGDVDEPGNRVRYQNALKLAALMMILGLAFFNADTFRGFDSVKNSIVMTRIFDFWFGAVLGATMAHFVIDAGAWRLSKASQREYMTRHFGFVLNRDFEQPSSQTVGRLG